MPTGRGFPRSAGCSGGIVSAGGGVSGYGWGSLRVGFSWCVVLVSMAAQGDWWC